MSRVVRPNLLRKADEDSLGATHVARPVRVSVLDNLINEFGIERVQLGKRLVETLDGEHNPQIAQSVDWGQSFAAIRSRGLPPSVDAASPHSVDSSFE